ncbi:MAG: hypothetical protein ABW208_27645 [Pyrinomonadaceae bacterium]
MTPAPPEYRKTFVSPYNKTPRAALYAVAQVAGVRGIFRSIDAGQTWVRVNR